ncbi:hypothetical protein GCM10011344_25830 [Dokdonia pacifica]|uniref:Uncharacterized protein n=1 Tax=Dokdonia pacifica TaxID=1627892 RepID=A0A238WTF8_9FLAO|nr:hypothetical protein [Dokdonia pacifica]GGG23869.1 hypothetical protein GCM10011344_25830 [Dokdonia pacifica]SNR49514.1 hypothetical protein SAMN06265376_1011440 [Dokdonia pacifica]
MDNWYIPITIIPGIGLLILSTSNLMVTLSTEINTLIHNTDENDVIINKKLIQLKLLNRAMVLFYIAISCLVTAALIGGISLKLDIETALALYVIILGIIMLLLGLFWLIKYSYRAVSIRQDQFKIKFNKK